MSWTVISLVGGNHDVQTRCLRRLMDIVHYLLKPRIPASNSRPRTAAAILTVYCILFLLLATTFFRLLYVVINNPGFVPRGSQYYENQTRSRGRRKDHRHKTEHYDEKAQADSARGSTTAQSTRGGNVPHIIPQAALSDTTMLQQILDQDIYTCEGDGKPTWCSTCYNYKPSRAHHCREVGRCVYKMDHFCPWAGGIISATSFKFFTQFVFFTAVYSLYNLVHMAVWVAELRQKTGELNVHWIITLAFGAFFGLFTGGMALSSMQFIFLNTTTIENLTRRTKVWQFAVRVHRPRDLPPNPPFNTVTFTAANEPTATDAQPGSKVYAILHTKRGENPYDLGYLGNWKSVMGEHWWQWLLPVHYSPCAQSTGNHGQYEMGDAARKMLAAAGLSTTESTTKTGKGHGHRKRRRRKSRSDTHVENKHEII